MKIVQLVRIEDQEVQITLGIEDIREAIEELADDTAVQSVERLVTSVHRVLKAVADQRIEKLSLHARSLIAAALHEQANRYLPVHTSSNGL